MTWRPDGPQGNEAAKVRFDVLPYCRTGGFDMGAGANKVWPHLIGVDNLKDTKLFGAAMRPDLVVKTVERLAMFADQCVDTVFSAHTLEHVVDYKATLAEWWRLLAPGGHLILYLPHRDHYPNIGQPGANPDHKHDFLPSDIIVAMQAIAPDLDVVLDEDRSEGNEYSFLQVYRKLRPGDGQHYTAGAAEAHEKRAGVVRVGGHGDALWCASILPLLKRDGYHVTVYASPAGASVLRHDPNIDRLFEIPDHVLTDAESLEFWARQAPKYTRWISLLGSVENRLLAHDSSNEFFLPHKLRHRLMNRNYLEMVHDYADLPHEFGGQRFHPTPAERTLAEKIRARLPGPLVVIAPAGSGPVKYWPHSRKLMELLAARGVYSVVLGDVPADLEGVEPFGNVVGMEWPVREACAFAQLADVVVATESLIANVVAFEEMPKVVTLSHSSAENLTKHWRNTAAIEPVGIPCHPCHRIHPTEFTWCTRDSVTRASACQAAAGAELIAPFVLEQLERRGKLPAPASAEAG